MGRAWLPSSFTDGLINLKSWRETWPLLAVLHDIGTGWWVGVGWGWGWGQGSPLHVPYSPVLSLIFTGTIGARKTF